MSTRGTYQITMQYTEKDRKILTHRDIDVCIYSQNDNYPSGAVEKFKNTLKLQKELKEQLNNTDFIECFIAANIREFGYMEITGSHYDTAYAYDILISDDIYLKCYKYLLWGYTLTSTAGTRLSGGTITSTGTIKRNKELYYDGLLMEFINNTAIDLLDK